MQGDFHIGEWLVQPQINAVEKGANHWRLEPKVMQVLVQLALHPNEVLSKDKLMSTVWRDTFVGDDVLVRCISEIRFVFGDDPRSPSVVQTIPKAGYRLIAAVHSEVYPAAATAPSKDAHPPIDHLVPTVETTGLTTEHVLLEPEQPAESVILSDLTLAKDPARHSDLVADHAPAQIEPSTPVEVAHRPRRRLLPVLIGLVAMTSMALGTVVYWRFAHPSAISFFWAPILEAHGPILFCVADQNEYTFVTLRDAADPSRKVVLKDNLSAVVIDDLEAVIRIASIFKVYGKDYRLKGQEVATLNDMRNGPSVFVGAFDNAWTLRLTKPLRFHFSNNADMTQFGVVDSTNPGQSEWIVNRNQQMATNIYKDYAIVARFTDSDTGQPAIIAAGIGRGGTEAAGEFLSDPDNLAQILPAMRAAPKMKNIEIVLSTQIIDGHSGRPKVEAIHLW